MIEAELHVIGGKHSGQVIPLNRPKFLIGRESDCQLRPNSELVSRHHCVFAIDEFSVRLRDLGSTNGTTVNGERLVKETTLSRGDRVVVGNLEFEYRVPNLSSVAGEETVVSGTKTVTETPSPSDSPTVEGRADSLSAGGVQPDPVPIDQPEPAPGDTTVIPQAPMMPGQPLYQPMMPQQMGFPGQMYGGYPYQSQPGVPMYPPGYPLQPQPVMPGQMPVYPQQPVPATSSEAATEVPDVLLPDPSETGVVEEPSKPKTESGGTSGNDGDSTVAAADIIRQYTQRPPG